MDGLLLFFYRAVNLILSGRSVFYASEANGSVLAPAAGLDLTPPPHSSG